MNLYNVRPFISWSLMVIAIIGVIYVGYYKSNSSTVIRVASGERTSYLFQIGKELKQAIETRSDYKVELVESGSSGINRGALQSGKADIGLISPSATDMTNLAVIAPIEKHLLHIVVHVDSGIRSIYGLSGKRISLGGLKSDHRKAAYKLLEHYQIEESALLNTEVSHLELLEGRNLDGAIISTSVNDTYMKKLMSSGNFSLIAIDAAEGFVERNNLFQNANFPMGVYPSSFGPMPDKWLPTVAENVWLVSRLDLSTDIVNMLIDVMETKKFTQQFPLLSKWLKESLGRSDKLLLHDVTKRRFNPYDSFKTALFDSLLLLWNMKWFLLFAIIIIWNVRSRWIGINATYEKDKQAARLQRIQALLEDVNAQEQEQADTKDYRLLIQHLAEIRRIKGEGIAVAKEQEMSDSAVFLCFLQQCDHVSRDIQWKLSLGINSKDFN